MKDTVIAPGWTYEISVLEHKGQDLIAIER